MEEEVLGDLIVEYLFLKNYHQTARSFIAESSFDVNRFNVSAASSSSNKRRRHDADDRLEQLQKCIQSSVLDYLISSDTFLNLASPVRKIENALQELTRLLHMDSSTLNRRKGCTRKNSIAKMVAFQKPGNYASTAEPVSIEIRHEIQNPVFATDSDSCFKTPTKSEHSRKIANPKVHSNFIADILLSPKLPCSPRCDNNVAFDPQHSAEPAYQQQQQGEQQFTTVAVFEPEKWEQVVEHRVTSGFSSVPDVMAEMINNCKAYSAGQEPSIEEMRTTMESNPDLMKELESLLAEYCCTDGFGETSADALGDGNVLDPNFCGTLQDLGGFDESNVLLSQEMMLGNDDGHVTTTTPPSPQLLDDQFPAPNCGGLLPSDEIVSRPTFCKPADNKVETRDKVKSRRFPVAVKMQPSQHKTTTTPPSPQHCVDQFPTPNCDGLLPSDEIVSIASCTDNKVKTRENVKSRRFPIAVKMESSRHNGDRVSRSACNKDVSMQQVLEDQRLQQRDNAEAGPSHCASTFPVDVSQNGDKKWPGSNAKLKKQRNGCLNFVIKPLYPAHTVTVITPEPSFENVDDMCLKVNNRFYESERVEAVLRKLHPKK